LQFLEKFCIPAPVVGGLLFAIIALILRQTGILAFVFNNTLQSVLMTAFFTTVGFTASLRVLKKGGVKVFVFLMAAIGLVVLQNILGVSLAKVFGLNELIGLATGSTPMTGGHGTSGAFAPLFEERGAVGAMSVAMASATFGLVMGSMIGGPIAKFLIDKNKLKPDSASDMKNMEIADHAKMHEDPEFLQNSVEEQLIPATITSATIQIIIAMGIGTIISAFLGQFMTFPSYIGAMFAAAIMRNISDIKKSWKTPEIEIEMIGGIALSLFLAMALSGLKLWELAELAVPMVVMLLAQTVLMAIYAIFVTFNVMGRDFNAAVITGGHCGFGMGATPNAIANMQAITGRFGPSPVAFFILPLVGSLFIDFFNAAIITTFMNFFG
ncbi:MAG: sodium/glutamate symporter, partial [Acidaminobacter sp.]|uniref:sodium/glutamate symporter n=1 Tax=Acidaminobacter sp. TaxID=1872102 RepID=UPI0013850737